MNQMGMVADAERLPWLTDDKPGRSKRGAPLVALGLVTTLLVAGASYWAGLRTAPGGETAEVPPSMTIPLPEPLVGKPQVIPSEPTADEAQPKPMIAPEAQPQRASTNIERKSSTRSKPRAAARKPVAATAPARGSLETWPVREVEGANGRMVRIGTFATARLAKRGWWKVVGTYPGMKKIPTLVVPVQSLRNGETYYRLQMGTTSHAHSEVLCQRMRIIGQSCVVIGLPQPGTGA